MNITVHAGHNPDGKIACGACGLINESTEARRVCALVVEALADAGHKVTDITVNDGTSATDILQKLCAQANKATRGLNVSIHFNNFKTQYANGVEVLVYNEKSVANEPAKMICDSIAALGFQNRGVKNRPDLYILKRMSAPTVLIECCFVASPRDIALYDPETMAKAISDAILSWCAGKENVQEPIDNPSYGRYTYNEKQITTREQFIEFCAMVAQLDWYYRRLCVPSVVIAQCMKESGCGTSELANKANALCGVKKNGWSGKTYVKQATEQRADGTYYTVDNTEWRAYDSWYDSIIDHNTYLATRKVGNQTELNWNKVIGEENYVLAVQHLQDAQYPYATSKTYAESLINGYIEQYHLDKYDTVTSERVAEIEAILFPEPVAVAPEGYTYLVVVGESRDKGSCDLLASQLNAIGMKATVKFHKEG